MASPLGKVFGMGTIIQEALGVEVIELRRTHPVTALELAESLLSHLQVV
jgi:hypothetical protein